MEPDLVEVEPQVVQPRATPGNLTVEEDFEKKSTYRLMTVADNLIKLYNSRQNGDQPEVTAPVTRKVTKSDLEGPCGLGCIVIPSCQRFNNIRYFLFLYCIVVICQGSLFSLTALSNQHFLKSNNLDPFENVLLSLIYDISSCLVVVFLSYYGGRKNIPRLITLSSFLVGFGSLLFAFPYFSGQTYQGNIHHADMCTAKKMLDACKTDSLSSQSKYMTFFILGQIIQGIAAVPLYIIGLTFLDESVSTHSSGIYIGFVESSVMVGYALGYIMSIPLTTFSEPNTLMKRTYRAHDSQPWNHQNWWLNFVIISMISWSTLIPLSCFPPKIKGTARIKAAKLKQPHLEILPDKEFGSSFKDLFTAIWKLMTAPMFVFLTLCRVSESLVLIGAAEFMPIYIENQFTLTLQEATALTGIILIPGGAVGQLLGGVIASSLDLSCKDLMRFVIITSVVSIFLLILVFFVQCNSVPLAGITEDYSGTGTLGNLTAPCNSHCHCSSSLYSVVCGRDDISYYSPCHAGCTHSKMMENDEAYYNCSCIKEGLFTSDHQGGSIDARSGTCDSKCYKLPLFLGFVLSAIVFSCSSAIPSILTILRVVSEKHRSLGLGLAYAVLRLLGTIPGPLVFKAFRENICIFRDVSHCGVRGNCWLYDKTKMNYFLVGLNLLCKIGTIIFMTIAFCLYKYLPKEKIEVMPAFVRNLKVRRKKKRTNL